MNFQSITKDQQQLMLDAIGIDSIDELYKDIPESVKLKELLSVEGGLDEMALVNLLTSLAQSNTPASQLVSFAGAGCYDHYIPSFIDHILRRPEFFTAYTPYQPEVSQGTLQAIYEYQSGICALTGMDISNASMYDGATALAEAAFMCVRLSKKRNRVVVASTLHPEWIETLVTYASSDLIELVLVPSTDGRCNVSDFEAVLDDSVAAVLLPYPNYYGVVEDIAPVIELAHSVGSLAVVAANPILLGILTSPGDLGADVVVGEGQSLGNSMSFGGPGLGFFACKDACTRQMPGRIVGKTVDSDGAEGYVLTLSTREQHIRREKATSNICSNHALNALAAGAYLAGVGPVGLETIATACVSKAYYLRDALLKTGLFTSSHEGPFGHEFALVYKGDREGLVSDLFNKGYVAGVPTHNAGEILFAVTEKISRQSIDAFVSEVIAHG